MFNKMFKIMCALTICLLGCSIQDEQADSKTGLTLDVSQLRKGTSSETSLVAAVTISDISDLNLYESGATDEKGNRLGISGAMGYSGPLTNGQFSIDMENMPVTSDQQILIEIQIAEMPQDVPVGVGNSTNGDSTINEYLIYYGKAVTSLADKEVKNLTILLESQDSNYADVNASLSIAGYNPIGYYDPSTGEGYFDSQDSGK